VELSGAEGSARSHLRGPRERGGGYVVHWSRYTVTTLGNIGRSRCRSRYKGVTKALQGVTKRRAETTGPRTKDQGTKGLQDEL
jgi:hypothetical protein